MKRLLRLLLLFAIISLVSCIRPEDKVEYVKLYFRNYSDSPVLLQTVFHEDPYAVDYSSGQVVAPANSLLLYAPDGWETLSEEAFRTKMKDAQPDWELFVFEAIQSGDLWKKGALLQQWNWDNISLKMDVQGATEREWMKQVFVYVTYTDGSILYIGN